MHLHLSLQSWIETEIGSDDLFLYLSQQKKNGTDVNRIYLVLTAHFIGKNITKIWSGRVWMSDEAMEQQVILVHKGQQMFICTEVGTYI